MYNYAISTIEKESCPENVIYEILCILLDKERQEININFDERVILLVSTYEGEIYNGGFAQYFSNNQDSNSYDGKFAELTVEALIEIKAYKNAQLVKDAIQIMGNSIVGELTNEQVRRLGELDGIFYTESENLSKLAFSYVSEHIESFIM